MRIDVNVSVAPVDSAAPGTRCEIKNLNSVRSMVDAISTLCCPVIPQLKLSRSANHSI